MPQYTQLWQIQRGVALYCIPEWWMRERSQIQIPFMPKPFMARSQVRKIHYAVWWEGKMYFFSPVNHRDSNQLSPAVSSYMWNRADFLRAGYTALWLSMSSHSKTCDQMVSCVSKESHASLHPAQLVFIEKNMRWKVDSQHSYTLLANFTICLNPM